MLKNEVSYNENQWQQEIIEIIQLLFTKYILAIEKVKIKDLNDNYIELDIILIDSNGNIDIIEIKRPFDKCIVSNNQYRDNYIPLRELSGTIMQIEKYILYLNKWGKKGENYLTQKYFDILPKNFKINITNPGGLIIMGRQKNLTNEQLFDFEVIKRKYKNIIDIITYDDLIKRLELLLQKYNNN